MFSKFQQFSHVQHGVILNHAFLITFLLSESKLLVVNNQDMKR
jgi:hypothetical protein